VVDLHLCAMTAPEAGAGRFIAVTQFLWMAEVAGILRERLGPIVETAESLIERGVVEATAGARV
jgi:hypothetical protein